MDVMLELETRRQAAREGGGQRRVEAQHGKGKLTALQAKNLDSIGAMGGIALVVNEDNIEDVNELLRRIERGES
jgi:hypothetical protein